MTRRKVAISSIFYSLFGLLLIGAGFYYYQAKTMNNIGFVQFAVMGVIFLLLARIKIILKNLPQTQTQEYEEKHFELHKQINERIDLLQKYLVPQVQVHSLPAVAKEVVPIKSSSFESLKKSLEKK